MKLLNIIVTLIVTLASINGAPVFAENDGAFLDPKYPQLVHPTVTAYRNAITLSAKRSPTAQLINKISSVKSQQNRGTCSIFSATAILEAQLILNHGVSASTDLSEEWLQFVVNHKSLEEGSTSSSNFYALYRYGAPSEETMPYIGDSWEDARDGLAAERCGALKGREQKICLLVHRNPKLMSATETQLTNPNSPLYDEEFLKARQEAKQLKAQYLSDASQKDWSVDSDEEIKALLDKGIPLTLDIDFYYGAWNHRSAEEKGIGRNMDHWNKGIVGFPEERSMDISESVKDPAGHSVLIVGYDDSKVVKTTVKMDNGKMNTFTYTGVYYFKNSWGTDGFGKEFKLGRKKYPGYGMITQEYAHQHGQFFQFPQR